MNARTNLLVLAACVAGAVAAPCRAAYPLVGAQVWFAPGEYDRPEEIDQVFRGLKEQRMPLARVSLVWNYIERSPGQWDFTIFDGVFQAAEKHGVKIAATLWPHAKSGTLGGVPDTEVNLKRGEEYLARVVERYRSSPALDTWILINEPGQPPADNPLANQRFREWLQKKYETIAALNHAWLGVSMVPYRPFYSSFEEVAFDPRWPAVARTVWPVPYLDWQEFWREHLTWYLGWIASHVRRIDPRHPLHTNASGGGRNLAASSQNLPAWRAILDTLGTSAYPMFYEHYLHDRYTLFLSYITDLLRGVMAPKPVWITEMPGGNIGYNAAFYADPSQMAQWAWTGFGAGAERVVFWLYNARFTTREVGQFGMLDFLGQPGDRVQAVSSVARTIGENVAFFESATPVESPVTLIVSLDSMSLNAALANPAGGPARDRDAPTRCLLGLYKAFSELGVNTRIRHIEDFEWRARTPHPRMAVLPHALALTREQTADIEAFVRNGNTLFATGFSGFYGPAGTFLPMHKDFPMEAVFGARPLNIRTVRNGADIELVRPALRLPSEQWVTEVANRSAEVIGRQEGWITAVRNKVGSGEAIWIPSPVGMASLQADSRPLAEFLRDVAAPFGAQLPFRFGEHTPDMLMRTLRNGPAYVTVVANTGDRPRKVQVVASGGRLAPELLWGKAGSLANNEVNVGARDTVVVRWR